MLPRMAKLLPAITAEELRANPISVAIEKVRGTARKRAAWGVQRGGGGALKAAHLEFLSLPPHLSVACFFVATLELFHHSRHAWMGCL